MRLPRELKRPSSFGLWLRKARIEHGLLQEEAAGIFVPLFSIVVVWVALGLAVVSALSGNRPWPIAVILVSLVNVIFLSPASWIQLGSGVAQGQSALIVITVAAFLAPVAAMIVSAIRGSEPRGG